MEREPAYYGFKLQKKSYEEYKREQELQQLKKEFMSKLSNFLLDHLGWFAGAFILLGSYLISEMLS